MTLPTAEMQFSVALTFSLTLESGDWITPNSVGSASGEEDNQSQEKAETNVMGCMSTVQQAGYP